MNNYFNPQTARPNIADVATGPLGGFHYGQDRQQYQQFMGLQQMMMEMEKRKQQEELERGLAMREAERRAKESGFNLEDIVNRGSASIPGYGQSIGMGNVGKAQQEQAKGQVALGTADTQTDMTNMQNRVSTMIAGARELELMAAASPMMAEGQYQKYKQTLSPQVAQMLPPNYTPEVPNIIKSISDRVMNSPEHRRGVATENIKGNYSLDRQRLANQGALDVAKEGTNRARLTGELKKVNDRIENQLAQIIEKIRNETATEQDLKMFETLQNILYKLKAAQSSGQIDPTMLQLMLLMQGGAFQPGTNVPPRGTPKAEPAPSPTPSPGAPKGELGTRDNPVILK